MQWSSKIDPITPQMRRYTTLWNIYVRNQRALRAVTVRLKDELTKLTRGRQQMQFCLIPIYYALLLTYCMI